MAAKKILNIKNSHGLSFDFLENGSVQRIEAGQVRISLKPATPFSKSGANLYLRKRSNRNEHAAPGKRSNQHEYTAPGKGSNPVEYTALTGPGSNSRFIIHEDSFIAKGSWAGLGYTCTLQISKTSLSWQWLVDVTNTSGEVVELDLFYVQDVGLKQISDGLVNEYYVSQYLERRILEDKDHGPVICCRQNMTEPTGHPWLMVANKNGAAAASTDGMQFYGKTYRETGIPEGLLAAQLGGEYAGESSIIALQEKSFILSKGEDHQSVFFATCLPDHPQATSNEDLDTLKGLLLEFGNEAPLTMEDESITPVRNLFNTAVFFPVEDLDDEELTRFFGDDRRHCEKEKGQLLSFFCRENDHVILRTKEILADRPHGHIMQAKTGFAPDENIVSTTAFAFGVFNSHLSQGNTNFNVFLSICTSQFNLEPETGQRIFVEINGKQYLLGVPSAFEMGLNHCRWIYKSGDHCFQIRTWTSATTPQVNMDFKVIKGSKVNLLITHDFDRLNGWTIAAGNTDREFVARPKAGSMIAQKFPGAQFRMIVQQLNSDYKPCGKEALFPDYQSLGSSLFLLEVREPSDFCMSFVGEVCSLTKPVEIIDSDVQWLSDGRDGQAVWQNLSLKLSLKGDHDDFAAIQEILPWFGMNALTHFLTPYGLEQFSGAAWGTRDVSQGPIDLLLGMEKYDEARQILRIIFSNQNPDGGWPQWWMFDSYANIRADDSHGDVVYWTIIALSNYIKVTGDLKILNETLPYFHEKGPAHAEKSTLSEHLSRLIKMIVDSFIPGTALVPFGGGDWNDSLQPVSRELARRMISSWTVEMNYQAFMQYQVVYEQAGNSAKAKELKEICEQIKTDFNKYLIKDGIVAGYGLVEEDGNISVLLHPGDHKTNIKYSILPMNRGIISEIFTKEQALYHQDLIEQHLKGPDGARLMDRPLKYQGGIQTIFQRAESSTFFGREIGLMYVHEHIRYAEAQARTGRAGAFVKALRQANPVAYRDIVPCGDIRQANCYYSSSDVAFKSRYEADERYDEIKTGRVALRGGWRVYSSGPGIYVALVVARLLGLRVESGKVIIDPVMPKSMDGLSASLTLMGHPVTFRYAVKEGNFGPTAIRVNGTPIQFSHEKNIYRKGGAVIPAGQFSAILDKLENTIEVTL